MDPTKDTRVSVDRDRDRPPSSPKKEKDEHLTTEEKLLAAILASNEELLEALRQYDDLERVGIERDAGERSKREIRMDRSVRPPVGFYLSVSLIYGIAPRL